MITLQILKEPNPAETEQLLTLYTIAGWITADEETAGQLVQDIVRHTFRFVIAKDGAGIIGMGRAISDGVSDAYIQDVTVLPEYRQQGIGGRIIDYLVQELHASGIGWIGLISEPGYERFYRKLGFADMTGYTPFLYTGRQHP